MSNFCSDQGRTRVFGEEYSLYAAAGNPRRTQIRAKRAIYGWKLNNPLFRILCSKEGVKGDRFLLGFGSEPFLKNFVVGSVFHEFEDGNGDFLSQFAALWKGDSVRLPLVQRPHRFYHVLAFGFDIP